MLLWEIHNLRDFEHGVSVGARRTISGISEARRLPGIFFSAVFKVLKDQNSAAVLRDVSWRSLGVGSGHGGLITGCPLLITSTTLPWIQSPRRQGEAQLLQAPVLSCRVYQCTQRLECTGYKCCWVCSNFKSACKSENIAARS